MRSTTVRKKLSYAAEREGERYGLDPVDARRWGVILAGGDGKRLLPLTRLLTGDDTPKQFCAFSGNGTLLDHTLRRVSHSIPRQNTLLLLTRTHERFYADQIRSLSTGPILVQPHNRGTAPAIAYAVTLLCSVAPDALVGFFPSDHHFESDDAIAASIRRAFLHARRDHERVVLLGIVPKSAENSYGWIEPGHLLNGAEGAPVFAVRRFWEKPSKETAQRLLDACCLWNSFIMVGHVSAFLNILRVGLPDLLAAFEAMWTGVKPGEEEAALRELFSKFPASSFSDAVLSACPSRLATLAVDGTGWTDLGEPERAQSTLRLEQLR